MLLSPNPWKPRASFQLPLEKYSGSTPTTLLISDRAQTFVAEPTLSVRIWYPSFGSCVHDPVELE